MVEQDIINLVEVLRENNEKFFEADTGCYVNVTQIILTKPMVDKDDQPLGMRLYTTNPDMPTVDLSQEQADRFISFMGRKSAFN